MASHMDLQMESSIPRKTRTLAVCLLAAATLVVVSFMLDIPIGQADSSTLSLDTKIPLEDVKGRIDHLAVDVHRQRLFVAELGNDSVAVVDLKTRSVLQRIRGLRQPQGVSYVAAEDLLVVANAGDGSVRFFRGTDLAPQGQLGLGDDADNIRIDAQANRVYVGYGKGAIAIIDPVRRTKIGDIPLKAHPEGFQLDAAAGRIYANVPDVNHVAVVDITSRTQIASWLLRNIDANYPLALDSAQQRAFVAARHPATLLVYNAQDGSMLARVAACGDADDVFADSKRHRVYVSCGEGFVDVFESRNSSYVRIDHVATVAGARTSLFVPELDRFFLAVRAKGNEPAAVWVFRPMP